MTKRIFRSEVSGLEMTRSYAYMTPEQWTLVDTLRAPLNLTVSQYLSNLVIAAYKAKESNVSKSH